MSKTIITTKDLIAYLKIPEFTEKERQEVIVRKLTREGEFAKGYITLFNFERVYKEVSLSHIVYVDASNRAYFRHRFSDENIFYKPITYKGTDAVYQESDFLEPLTELRIPEEIFNEGYDFYINQDDKIVASIQVVGLNSTRNYLAFNPRNFEYLKSYPVLDHAYTSVYGATTKDKIKITSYNTKEFIHRFPILTIDSTTAYKFRLSYYYKKDSNQVISIPPNEDDDQYIGLSIYFKNLATVLDFLNKTIFGYFNEYNDYRSSWRARFLDSIMRGIIKDLNSRGDKDKEATIVYHLSPPLYYSFKTSELWILLQKLAKGYVRNTLGINEEDLILKILRITYHRTVHKRVETTINGRKVLEEQDIGGVLENTKFISNILHTKVEGELLLYRLIKGLDGAQFRTYVNFIWKIWKSSAYANIDVEANKLTPITEKSSVLLDYRSDKELGFHVDNATITWEKSKPAINIAVKIKTGTEEPKTFDVGDEGKPRLVTTSGDVYEKQEYTYHPFAPIVLINSNNPKFILKDEETQDTLFTKLPAFLLYANKEAAFWENVLKGVEYAVDIFTTISGVGNLLKAGRLLKVLKRGKSLLLKTPNAKQVTKAITGVKAIAGTVEITSGTVNTLLKLTGAEDTELGRTIAKYLFYLEMAALAGEISVALRGKLQQSARKILEKEKTLRKIAKNTDEVKQVDQLIEELNHVGGNLGGGSIVATKDPKKVQKFIKGLERLQKLKVDNPFEYIEEALPYFNHRVVGDSVEQVGKFNCGDTSEFVVHFLKTGEVKLADPSPMLSIDAVAAKFNSGGFFRETLLKMRDSIKDGRIVVIRGVKKVITYKGTSETSTVGHYFVGMKVKGELHLFDGQTGESVILGPTNEAQVFLQSKFDRDQGWFEFFKVE